MTKKALIALGILILTGGTAFAQNNTVTVDIGPTIVGLAVGPAINAVVSELENSASGFGIGAQYERQILKSFSVAGRFAYLGAGLKLPVEESSVNATLDIDLKSFSVEGHARYYPFGETFFVDGMVGYANLSTTLDGSVSVKGYGTVPVGSFSPSRNYLKLGAKLGWRFCFGNNGGFTFEPSFGYSYGIGLGDSIEDQLADQVKKVTGSGVAEDFNDAFKYIENLVFIGGPRVSLAFGWRF